MDETQGHECLNCERLRLEVETLKVQVAEAKTRVDKLEALLETSLRGRKRQAAPFSKGEPKKSPKKPGRKSGDG